MKPSEKIKQEIETLLEELKELGYEIERNGKTIIIYRYVSKFDGAKYPERKYYLGFEFNDSIEIMDEIIENLLKLKVRV